MRSGRGAWWRERIRSFASAAISSVEGADQELRLSCCLLRSSSNTVVWWCAKRQPSDRLTMAKSLAFELKRLFLGLALSALCFSFFR
uniref:Uncharacterized protein n=1 Tax=Oryza glumipatula TaxID=40148 RepID=A0A0E0B951_9ORYZ